MNILDTLAASSKKRVEESKKKIPVENLKIKVGKRPSFKKALSSPGISFICELKKASPSKGLIVDDFDYERFADEYESSGASAISCLTEPEYFLGSLEYLEKVSKRSTLPILRKDFIVDSYQIYEAAAAGASAVLLICAILSQDELDSFYKLTKKLGMDALVEVHNEEELQRALAVDADIIGVNNRDLRDFSVDLNTTKKLSENLGDVLLVSESGIKTPEDVKYLSTLGVNAVLIGEQLMKSGDIPEELSKLKNYEN